jgi:hypothetical protein
MTVQIAIRWYSGDDLPAFGNAFDRCPSCAVWARQDAHPVVARDKVFA